MFVVPKGARRPWLLGTVALVIAVTGVTAWSRQGGSRDKVVRPFATSTILKRSPMVVVEDLPMLKAQLERMAEHGQFTGGVLVAKGNQVLFRQTYGMANYEQKTPFSLDTRMRLASVSKQFTGVAILKLQDEGKLSISDPVCKWIENCPDRWSDIRISHVLSHSSGIPDLMAQANWGMVRTTPHTPDELMAKSAQYSLQFEPGTKVRYNNVGFNIGAYIVSKVSGMAYEDYLRTALFEPLGMKDTGSDVHADAQGVAMGYGLFPQGLTPQPNANVSIIPGAGALYSTLDDMLVWNRALHGGHILSGKSYAELIADHSPADTPNERGRPHRAYGLGIFSNSLGSRTNQPFDELQIYHTGSWSGFRNLVTYEPSQQVTVVVLSNNYHLRDQVLLLSQQGMAEALGHPFPTAMAK